LTKAVRAILLLVVIAGSVSFSQNPARWYKGNMHTHTINSDGDSPPAEVVAWYKRHGYNFLVLTDHNTFTDPKPFDSNPNDNFLLVGGEEITNSMVVHVNAIGIDRIIPEQKGQTSTAILQASIDAVRETGGIALINHPNFLWAFTAKAMLPLKNARLLEIASGHPLVNHKGDGVTASTEQMWDELLSSGMHVFAVAVDDAHNFREEFTAEKANPGRAWVGVRANALTRDAIVSGLDTGNFYASTGVELKDVQITNDSFKVEIQSVEGLQPAGRPRYRVSFIGKNGRLLTTSNENPAVYKFRGDEGYVRARVDDSNGLQAWTQPGFLP
jgi:hypothetical protein